MADVDVAVAVQALEVLQCLSTGRDARHKGIFAGGAGVPNGAGRGQRGGYACRTGTCRLCVASHVEAADVVHGDGVDLVIASTAKEAGPDELTIGRIDLCEEGVAIGAYFGSPQIGVVAGSNHREVGGFGRAAHIDIALRVQCNGLTGVVAVTAITVDLRGSTSVGKLGNIGLRQRGGLRGSAHPGGFVG